MAVCCDLSRRSNRLLPLIALLSLLALHLSVVAGIEIQLPVALKKFDFESLPVYCAASTMHFKCRDASGSTHCLPVSHKCRIQCANDAELKCPNSATNCTAGQFRCATSEAGAAGAPVCLPDERLCDGRVHCPAGDDESPELCLSRRVCPPNRFPCRSPGHCLPAGRRCDGHLDCRRPGLDDRSDEADCPTVRPSDLVAAACPDEPDAFRCADGSGCVQRSYVCDGFPDCLDSSDESCGPVACARGEFDCDGRCLPAQRVRCDGRVDCRSGADEQGCPDHADRPGSVAKPCGFASDFRCHWSGACVSRIFLCDGAIDCKGGSAEDEICPIDASDVCRRPDYWTCASGTHCVPATVRCDGFRQCPDASDEANCTTANLSTTTVKLTVESVALTASGVAVGENCSFGRCSQLCNQQSGQCECRPGYQPSAVRSCLALGAGKLVIVSGTVEVVDLETERTVATIEGLDAALGRVALDAAEQRLIYIDAQGRLASVRLLDGGNRWDLGIGYEDVIDLAYDWTRRLLFYSTLGLEGEGSVGVVDVAGGGWRAVLRVLDCPGALAVDPRADGPPSLFIFLGCGRQPGIYRMSLDGRDLRLLLDTPTVGRPAQIRLDLAQSPPRIYWTDADHPRILSALLDGRDLRHHAESSGVEKSPQTLPVALSVFEDNLYLTSVSSDSIVLVDKFATDFVPRRRYKFAPKIGASFLLQHAALQPRDTGFNASACRVCKQICLPASAGFGQVTCLCDWHHRVDPRTGRCNSIGRASVLVRTRNKAMATMTSADRGVSLATTMGSSQVATRSSVLLAVALSAAVAAVLIAGGVAFCVHRRVSCDRQSMEIESSKFSIEDNKNLRSVDSRTPLTSSTAVAECRMV